MASKPLNRRTTTSLIRRGDSPLHTFGSQFLWDLSAGDVILVIPPKGKYFYISTTSLSTLTRIICKIGGPNGISALSNRISEKLRTYTISIERRFLHPENKILNSRKSDYRKRSSWTEEEWIQFFKGVGRSRGGFKLFITIWYRKLKNLKLATDYYWEVIEKAGLCEHRPKV